MRFNRNIITPTDIKNFKDAGVRVPALDQAPPAGVHPAIADAAKASPEVRAATDAVEGLAADSDSAPGGVTVPTEDDYLTKLLKYVPAEIIGLYLLFDASIRDNVTGTARATWLAVIGLVVLAFTPVYDWFTLNIRRRMQIVMSVIGLAVYIFMLGGWFATTTWYKSWYATFAVAAFAIAAAMLKLSPLPIETISGDDPGGAAAGGEPVQVQPVAAAHTAPTGEQVQGNGSAARSTSGR